MEDQAEGREVGREQREGEGHPITSETCPKCGATDQLRPIGWRNRIVLALPTGLVILIPGLALTMIGAGLPLLIASPLSALLLLVLPLERCGSCGHMAVHRSG